MGRELTQGEVVQKAHDLIDKSQRDVDINREFESLPPSEQLKVAREATKYQKEQYPDLPLVVFGGMESEDPAVAQMTRAEMERADKHQHPERQAKRIEEAGKKLLAGEPGADAEIQREIKDLQNETPEYRQQVIRQVEKDGDNHNPFNPVPHAEVEYREDGEPEAIVFSKNFGWTAIGGKEERVDMRTQGQKDADQMDKINAQKAYERQVTTGNATEHQQINQLYREWDIRDGRVKEPCTPEQNVQQKDRPAKEQTCVPYN